MIRLYVYTSMWHVRGVEDCFLPTRDFALKNDFLFWETPQNDPYSYWKALKENWMKDDILLLEHDVLPTVSQINEILDCPHSDCGFRYGSDKNPNMDNPSAWDFNDPKDIMNRKWHYDFKEYADGIVFGLVKISKEYQSKTPIDPPIRFYEGLDTYLSFRGMPHKWHVHKYVVHNHLKDYNKILGR